MSSVTAAGRPFTVEINPYKLFARVRFGATGSMTSPAGLQQWIQADLNSPGPWGAASKDATSGGFRDILSVVRVSVGLFTITFGPTNIGTADQFIRLLAVSLNYNTQGVSGGAVVPAAPFWAVTNDSVTTGTFQVSFYNSSGVLADPASGEIVSMEITVSNSPQ